MKDYASMSDQQINQLVGAIVSRDGLSIIASNGNAVIHEYSDCGDFKGICLGWKVFDPCNNPADAWPVITESRIAIIPDTAAGEWVAFNEFTLYEGDWMFASDPAHHSNGKNPLRCAMTVFLMMKEGEL